MNKVYKFIKTNQISLMISLPIVFVLLVWIFPVLSNLFGIVLIVLTVLALEPNKKSFVYHLFYFPFFLFFVSIAVSVVTLEIGYTLGSAILTTIGWILYSYLIKDMWLYIKKNRKLYLIITILFILIFVIYANISSNCIWSGKGGTPYNENLCKTLNLLAYNKSEVIVFDMLLYILSAMSAFALIASYLFHKFLPKRKK